MKSFHDHTHVRIPTVASIGESSGKTTLRYTIHVLAPSSSAASSSSMGIDRMNATKNRVFDDRPNTVYSRMRPAWLSIPSSAVCLTTGSMMMGNGTKIADTR